MNPNTWISFVTSVIGMAASAAATDGLITGDMAKTISGFAIIWIPIAWGWFIHRDSKVAQTAGAIPGVKPVEVTAAASPELQRIAADPSVRTVVRAPEPLVSSTFSKGGVGGSSARPY